MHRVRRTDGYINLISSNTIIVPIIVKIIVII